MPMCYQPEQITAAILAGGRGLRMGGLDKGLLIHRGRPLVTHLAGILRPQARELLLSANRSHDRYRALGFSPLADRRADYAGPLAGIETALAVCSTPYLLVCPCDTPYIPGDLGQRLWEGLHHRGAQACHATTADRPHYLHLLLHRETAAAAVGDYLNEGGRAVRHWLARLTTARVMFDEAELINLNDPHASVQRRSG